MQHQRIHGRRWGLALTAALALLTGCGSTERVSFSGDVQPIFDNKCTSCHPVSFPQLDLRRGRSYRQLVGVGASNDPAFTRVVPGNPDYSWLIVHVPDPRLVGLLNPMESATIRRWISEGAPDN